MTNQIQEKSFQNWSELKVFLDELRQGKEFIWRGHASEKWVLSSSLFRYFESQKVPNTSRKQYEEKAIKTFIKHYANELKDSQGQVRTTIDIMVAMQHYGCPTRLLDWTKSPYIAAFFCLADMDEIGAIYGLNLTEYQDRISRYLPLDDYNRGLLEGLPDRYYRILLNEKNLTSPVPLVPRPLTQRHFDQQSVLLLDLKLDIPTEKALSSTAPKLIWKITFPREIRKTIYSDLRQMNVDGYHLFKGMDGIALNAKHMLYGALSFGESILTDDIKY
ncbi:MAG: FRG domain-containing protein [Candidatus Hodarchaeales archaeon]